MRFVDRSAEPEPASLATPDPVVAKEIAAAAIFYATYDPLEPEAKGYGFKEYKGYDVTQALIRLFHNKCAYCETDLGDNLDVEHFRPKGGVTDVIAHTGYWWLAHTWENLLPSCPPCNQRRRQHIVTPLMTVEELTALMAKRSKVSWGKANQFPVSGIRAMKQVDDILLEEPDLIDPTLTDPTPFLCWSKAGHYSVILPVDAPGTKRALETINVFALNRVRLVQSRTRILTELRFQAQEIKDDLEADKADGGASGEPLARALKRVEAMRRLHGPDHPYSAMVKAFVDDFVQELAARAGP